MAKKTNAPAEAADEKTPASSEPKKQKAPKEAKAKEAKVREPKPKAKTAPDAPADEAPETPGSKPEPSAAPPADMSPDKPSKKRGKRPGVGPRRGKKLRNHLRNVIQKLASEGPMPLKRAIGQLKQMKRSKFDETVEVHMSLGIDVSQNDQVVRGSVPLPHGLGKSVRVLVFCQGDNVAKAKEAGADYAGSDEFIKKIQSEGWLEFDVALASQDMMGQVSRLGKVPWAPWFNAYA